MNSEKNKITSRPRSQMKINKEKYLCNNCGQSLEDISKGILMCHNCGWTISKGEKRLGIELDAIAKAKMRKDMRDAINEVNK